MSGRLHPAPAGAVAGRGLAMTIVPRGSRACGVAFELRIEDDPARRSVVLR
jgi:hypothetical protein